ncbi:MAG: dephospho-CoA kinase [Hydrogenophaga sp.]|nr:dephospho-CoA kinase [Hydrogenophaga sp.]
MNVAPALRLGLTGGIGSGKSTVAQLLAGLGAQVLDADAMSRASTAAGGSAMPEIRRVFGDAFVAADGSLNRDQMRERVFSDPTAKQALEAIVHPCVQQAMANALQHSTARCVVFDVPLLVESTHWRARVDAVLVVDCDSETQVQRVVARNGWAREAVDAVIRQQASRQQRLAAADAVVFNGAGNTLLQLERDVRALATSFGL